MAISENDRHDVDLRQTLPSAVHARGIAVMLRRQMPLIALVTFICAAISLTYALLVGPKHTASGRVLLDPANPLFTGTDAASHGAGDVIGTRIESQIYVMTSRTILDRVIEREKLDDDLLFGARSKEGLRRLLVRAGLVAAIDPHAMALRQLERVVSVKRNGESFVVSVSAVTPDGGASARVANAVMDSYVEEDARIKSQAASHAPVSRDAQLSPLLARLRDAERRIEQYRRDMASATDGSSGEKQVNDVSSQITAAEAKADGLRSALAQIRRARGSGDLEAVPRALRTRTIEAIRNRYAAARRIEADLAETLGPKHPDLRFARMQTADARRLLAGAIEDLIDSTAVDLERATANVTRLRTRLEASKKDLATSKGASTRLRELERDVDESRAIYQASLLRLRGAGEQQWFDGANARILSRATPPLDTSGASVIRVLFTSILLGLGLGTSLALMVELLRGRKEEEAVR